MSTLRLLIKKEAYITQELSVHVEKVWELQDKEAGTVTIYLLADGEKVDTVNLSSENDWKYTFTDLPTVHVVTDESAIVYTVEEVAVEEFDSEVTGNAKDGYTVTNSEQIDLNDSGEGTPSLAQVTQEMNTK